MNMFWLRLRLVLVVLFSWVLLPFYLLISLYKCLFAGRSNSLRNKIIMVTGAGNGLGREIARQLVKLNCTILCVDMKKDDLEDTVQILIKEGANIGQLRSYICDITDSKRVTEIRDLVLQEFGKLDVLINNAGLLFVAPFGCGSDEIVRRCVDVNVLGTVWMTRAFLPSMKERNDGQIVFINSAGGMIAQNDVAIYCMTKAALSALAIAIDEELRGNAKWNNVKLTSAHPAFIDSNPTYRQFYKSAVPRMTLKYTAKCVLEGTRRKFEEFLIPGGEFTARLLMLILRVFPRDFAHLFVRGMGVEFGELADMTLFDQFTSPDVSHKMVDTVDFGKGTIIFSCDRKESRKDALTDDTL